MTHGKKLLLITVIFGAVMGGLAVAQAAMDDGDMKRAVSRQFDDPSSTQFRGVRRVSNGYCGSVNAKNRMGGYAGYEDFFAERSHGGGYYVRFRRGGLPGDGQEYIANCSR